MYDSLEAMHYNRVKVNRVYVMWLIFVFGLNLIFFSFFGGNHFYLYREIFAARMHKDKGLAAHQLIK